MPTDQKPRQHGVEDSGATIAGKQPLVLVLVLVLGAYVVLVRR